MLAIGGACTSPSAAAPGASASPDPGAQTRAPLGDTVHVQLGRSASVDAGRLVLTFLSHGTDSRCAANVVCVWAGDVPVRIAARTGRTSAEVELHTGLEPHSLTVDGYVVTLVGFLPYPGTNDRSAPTAVLRVGR